MNQGFPAELTHAQPRFGALKLSELAQGRDNNFNLIRILAALAVLISHSYPILGGPDPLQNRLGMTIGLIGVDVFFVTSGFLVTASLLARQRVTEFARARALRIFPALWVMLLLTVFVLGAHFSALPPTSYFSRSETFLYLAKCATLFFGVAYDLPEVFIGNPYPGAVNGSLWTLPYEVYMYLVLALVWLGLSRLSTGRLDRFKLVIVAFAIASGGYVLAQHAMSAEIEVFHRLFFMFFAGAACHMLREKIYLSKPVFWLLALSLAFAGLDRHLFFVVYALTLAYLVLYLAYVPSGWIRRYNALGDYSYGLYIYAFPVQQAVVALAPGLSVLQMILISLATTLAFAVLSWHLLEARALRLKDRGTEKVSRQSAGRANAGKS